MDKFDITVFFIINMNMSSMSTMSMTYYSILNVEEKSTISEIETSYDVLSKKNHPNCGGKEDTFSLISEAYEVLSDPIKRYLYDRTIYTRLHLNHTDPYILFRHFNRAGTKFSRRFVNKYPIYSDFSIVDDIKMSHIFNKSK